MEPFAERFTAPRDDSSQFWQGLEAGPIEEHEKPKLDRLRAAMQDITEPKLTDYVLLNFLRARENKSTKAEAMLREALEIMSKENTHPRMLLDYEPTQAIMDFCPYAYCGFTRENQPIGWIRSGRFDCPGFPKVVTRTDYVKVCHWVNCHVISCSREAGNTHPTKVEVFDLEGMGMDVVTSGVMGLMQHGMKFMDATGPEFVGKIFVINAPGFFSVLWTMLRPMMSAHTASKIVVCGKDYQQALQEIIAPEQIPTRYGGTSTRLPLFFDTPTSDILHIPKELYTTAAEMDGETVNVGRGSSHQADIEVTAEDLAAGKSMLMWKFFSEGYDCGFAVYWKPAGSGRMKKAEMEEIFPDTRYDCHICPQTDQIEITKAGVYVLRFDNTYSYMHSKDVTYEVTLCENVVQDFSTAGAAAEH